MQTTEVLQKAAAAVAAVESKLAELDSLTANDKTQSEAIEAIQNDVANLLKSEATEEQKVKSLLKVRATLDVKNANLAKIRNEIGAAQEELRTVGDKAQLWIGALIDALVVARRNRVSEKLQKLFIPQSQLELKRFLPYSLLVHQIEPGIERLQWYPVAQAERNVATARKVRPTFDQLAKLVEAEEQIELIVGPNW
jgi:hypothetical protein